MAIAPAEPPTPEPPAGPRFRWIILPMAALTGLIIYLLVSRLAGVERLSEVLEGVSWGLIAVAVGLVAVSLVLASVRFRLIIAAMDVKLPFRRAFDAIISTWPLMLVTPSRANDLLRAVAIRDLLPIAEGASAVVAEKLVDVQSLCLLTLFGGALIGQWDVFGVAALMLVAEWTVALLLLRNRARITRLPLLRRAEKTVDKLFAAFAALRARPRALLVLSAVSLGSWLVVVALTWVLLAAFGARVSYLELTALWPIAVFVGMLPLTVAGMGTRDAAFVYLLAHIGNTTDEASALAATFSYAVLSAWLPALVGLWPMLRQMRQLAASRRRPPADAAEPR